MIKASLPTSEDLTSDDFPSGTATNRLVGDKLGLDGEGSAVVAGKMGETQGEHSGNVSDGGSETGSETGSERGKRKGKDKSKENDSDGESEAKVSMCSEICFLYLFALMSDECGFELRGRVNRA